MIEYADASPEVRDVYDDIMATRQTDWITNFWKALAHDPLTKEMMYLAVSASNQCPYCIASHGMANETNRLASGYQVEIDERLRRR